MPPVADVVGDAIVKILYSRAVYLRNGDGDPNGIRTRVTAVKGRCPGPLDDRVAKAGQYRIEFATRKANWERECRSQFSRLQATRLRLQVAFSQDRQPTVPYEQ